MIYTLYYLSQVLAALVTHAMDAFSGVLDGDKVVLFTNTSFDPTESTAYADLTQPNFTGYAVSSAVVWGAPLNVPGGGVQVVASTIQFTATDAAHPCTITGHAIITGSGNHLLAVVVYDEPIPVLVAGDGVAVVPTVQLTPTGFKDGSVSV